MKLLPVRIKFCLVELKIVPDEISGSPTDRKLDYIFFSALQHFDRLASYACRHRALVRPRLTTMQAASGVFCRFYRPAAFTHQGEVPIIKAWWGNTSAASGRHPTPPCPGKDQLMGAPERVSWPLPLTTG